jgi:DNA-binding protein HU-beta
LAAGEELPLAGIGKFKVATRAARLQRNPQTGDTYQAPAKRVPKFTLAKALKDAVTNE